MGDSKCLRETKGRRHPDVDPKVISQLRKYFAEHNQKFYELVGEDLGWPEEWNEGTQQWHRQRE